MKKMIYLDYSAATPLDNKVLAAMRPYFSEKFYNPSATYLPAQQVKKDIETARAKVARQLGTKPSEIIFTAGGTEANNLAIYGVMQKYPDGNIVVSAIEHESVLKPAEKYKHKITPVLADGIINIEKLAKTIDDNTVLVSVMYANNEIGTIQPLRQIAQLIQMIKKNRLAAGNTTPLFFHTDACQAANYLDLHVSRLGVDMMTLNGSKIYGPKQSGLLFVHAGISLEPQISGGGQERGLRSGTENVVGIIGLAAALEAARKMAHEETACLQTLQKLFFELLEESIPTAVVNGSRKHRLPNNVHITLPGYDNERLIIQLEQNGVLCAAGSACSASNEEPSHVLKAIGLSDKEARASLRFTMGRGTNEKDIRRTIDALAICL